jgi:hypothetical protein
MFSRQNKNVDLKKTAYFASVCLLCLSTTITETWPDIRGFTADGKSVNFSLHMFSINAWRSA